MIVVTGATGKLGRHVITELLRKIPAAQIVAAVRTPANAQDLAALGVQVREADYTRPETLTAAFAGAEKILLISSNDIEHRIAQQKAVVDAAKTAGAKLIAYTSILHADTSTLLLASDHKVTEAYIKASGIPYAFLRNGWYHENRLDSIAPALAHGAILGAAGQGRFAAASRADYAAAAAAVLTENAAPNQAYELAGDNPYTLAELAAEISTQSGKPVQYHDVPEQAYAEALAGFGLPAPFAAILAQSDAGATKGELDDQSHTLSRLIGRPTTTLAAAVAAALKQ